MKQDNKHLKHGKLWGWGHSLWLLLTILPGLSGIAFFYISYRVRKKTWILFGFIYSIPFFLELFRNTLQHEKDSFSAVIAILWIAAIIHAFVIRNKYLMLLEERKESVQKSNQISKQSEVQQTKVKTPVISQAEMQEVKKKIMKLGDGSELEERKPAERIQPEYLKRDAKMVSEVKETQDENAQAEINTKIEPFGHDKPKETSKNMELLRSQLLQAYNEIIAKDNLSQSDIADFKNLAVQLGLPEGESFPLVVKLENQYKEARKIILTQRYNDLNSKGDNLSSQDIEEFNSFANQLQLPEYEWMPYVKKLEEQYNEHRKLQLIQHYNDLSSKGDNLSQSDIVDFKNFASRLGLPEYEWKFYFEQLEQKYCILNNSPSEKPPLEYYQILIEKKDLSLKEIEIFERNAIPMGLQREWAEYYAEKLHERYNELSIEKSCLSGNLEAMEAPPVFLKKNEQAYFSQKAEVTEVTEQTKTHRLYAGTRIKIGGIPIYLGGSTPITTSKEYLKSFGEADFVITDKRIIISGSKVTYSIPFDKLLDLQVYKDGIQIMCEGSYNGRGYIMRRPELASMVLQILLAKQ